MNNEMLSKIKSEVKKYINLDDTEQEALIEKVVAEVKIWENDNLDPNIEGIVYQFATDFDLWYEK